MKRTLAILLTVLLLAALCACGGGGQESSEPDYVYFKNDTGVKMDGFYISSVGANDWGDELNLASVSAGGSIQIDADKLPDGSGEVYDVGAVDENGMNYDFYEVEIYIGDVLAIGPAEGDTATLTVTDINGYAQVYDGSAYLGD